MGLRCSPSVSMCFRRRARRSSSWASWRIRQSRSTRRRSSREGITYRLDETAGNLGVSPAAAPQEVEQDETAEEEDRDDEEEAYDAEKQVECVQYSPFHGCRVSRRKKSGRPDLNRRPLGPQPS